MVIDFHTHCFADALAPSAIDNLQKKANMTAVHDGTLGGLKAYMAACGVDQCVIQPVATKPSQISAINKWAHENMNNQAIFFGALHPDDPYFVSTAKKLKETGFKGAKLHPDYQRFFADESRMMPLYEALRDLGLVVVLHAGVDIGLPAPVHCTPIMLKRIIENIPGLKLVAAHMGSHALWRDVEDVLLGLPLYIDTSYSCYALQNADMSRMICKHGAQNVLFGTDSPWMRADDEMRNIMDLDLALEDKEAILFRNAQLLLK